jgi:hypothetical protein
VHAIDRPGYPIRRRIDFQSRVFGANGEPVSRETRHVYNCNWPAQPAGGSAGTPEEADLIVVVDDGHAVPGATGLAAAVAAATGTPVLLAVLTRNAGPTPDADR